jgi:hypothetical protein
MEVISSETTKNSIPTKRRGFERPDILLALVTILTIAVFVFISLRQIVPPNAVPSNAALTGFSSGRAMERLKVVAQKPHPVGSQEHDNVRDYLLREISAMGLRPEVQKATTVNRQSGFPILAGTVENIFVRLPGSVSGKAVLFACHYDSQSSSPGASDDGAAVVTMLETLQCLRSGPPLKNTLIFLFTDSEEIAQLGAHAFVEENPVMKEVALALNFDARGVSGPSILFETSKDNGLLIEEVAKAAPYPVATSLAFEIYKILPNTTDFTVFKSAGMAGLNFAYINGVNHYHSPLDTIERIDERSLQHHGSYALALARHFGNLNLTSVNKRNAVYFNILASVLVYYSEMWVKPLAIFAFASVIGVTVFGLKKKRLTLYGVTLGFIALLFSMLISALVVGFTWRAVLSLHSSYRLIVYGDTYNSPLYLAGFSLISIAVTAASYIWLGRKISVQDLTLGGALWWLILTILTGFYLPGGSYLFVWPLIFSLISLGFILVSNNHERHSIKTYAVISICSIAGIILFVPMIYLIFQAIALSMPMLIAVMVVLQLGLLIPHIHIIAKPKRWPLASGAILGAVGFIVAGSLTAGFDESHRRPNSIFYAMNTDLGKAVWASPDIAPDEWTSQFFTRRVEKGLLTDYIASSYADFTKGEAPLATLHAPQIDRLGDEMKDGNRIVRLRVASSRQAPIIVIAAPVEVEVSAFAINQKRISNPPAQRWGIAYLNLPKEGLDLTLELKSKGPVKMLVYDVSYGLPDEPSLSFSPRPNYMMPSHFSHSDTTVVSRFYNF